MLRLRISKALSNRSGRYALALLLVLPVSLACAQASSPSPLAPPPPTLKAGTSQTGASGVVVVLAGGGAKGFAHLAVLRRLERERVPIARIVGTSMGAVIGGLYAAGMSTEDIEQVIGSLDPARVALDQLDRLELPQRTRAQRLQYPIDLEFGVRDGKLSFARGFSDGQRFLELLQRLLADVPSEVDFNHLKIPFRAVATRYRDGETQVFDRGSLYLAIRASMAAPGVFAPVEIGGETYVDGGLVANLPIEIALQEDAAVVVASYLGAQNGQSSDTSTDALQVANRMLDILIHQNERRNLQKLRPQDILVQPKLENIGFTDFQRAADIVALGEQAVRQVEPRFTALGLAHGGLAQDGAAQRPLPPVAARPWIREIRVTGNQDVPAAYIQQQLAPLANAAYSPEVTEQNIDALYTTGHFERVSYTLQPQDGQNAVLAVDVREKPYGPHIFKTSFGLLLENKGTRQFGLNIGYRRPWLTESGLEMQADLQLGTNIEAGLKLYQPLTQNLGLEAYASHARKQIPIYESPSGTATSRRPLAYGELTTQKIGLDFTYQFGRVASLSAGGIAGSYRARWAPPIIMDAGTLIDIPDTFSVRYSGLHLSFLLDQLDAPSFPTQGYYLNASSEIGLGATKYSSTRISARSAHSMGPHILNFGANFGNNKISHDCTGSCTVPSDLFLGGFQLMGAYRLGELSGDRLVHVQGTYMYQLSTGGLLRQKTYAGLSIEAGNAWNPGLESRPSLKQSRTLFIAVDSKIGDIYLGLATGSGKARNAFVQLGRRFSL